MGSFGNGGAMQVAPLGAYFSHDIEQLCQQAMLSAEVTHSHIDWHVARESLTTWESAEINWDF
jgi:ADP-ribosylglycohydrolase